MEDIFVQFKQKFIDDSLNLITGLEKSLIRLENNCDDNEAIEEVFRFAHTLKGVSGMYGFDKIAEYTHKLESLFDCIRNQALKVNSQIIDLTLESADHIKRLLSDSDFSDIINQSKHFELTERISQYVCNEKSTSMIKNEPETCSGKACGTYYICFYPDEHLIFRGVKIVNIFHDLAEIGTFTIFKHLPNVITDENFHSENAWGIILSTCKPVSAIEDIFLFMEDNYKFFKLSNTDVYSELAVDQEAENKNDTNLIHIESLAELSQKELSEVVKQKITVNIATPVPETKINETIFEKTVSQRMNVDINKLDMLMYLVSELVTSNAQLKLGYSNADMEQLGQVTEKIEKLTKQFRDNAFSLRLISIEENVVSFHRLVRDLSHNLNKTIQFVIEGGETELDKSIMDKLIEPLMHLIRNCIDHGIETPPKRIEAGKPTTGIIKLVAYHSGNHIYIRVEDDGYGIDNQKIIEKAIEKGIITSDAKLSQSEIYDLIFLPGFSTAESLTEISGRGVGMNVVKRKIQELHGEVHIESQVGKGTTFVIKLQQTISIIDTLLTRTGNSTFAIPLSEIENCQLPISKAIFDKQNKHLDYMGQLIPYVNLRHEFDCFSTKDERQKILVINRVNMRYAIIVDEIIGEYQAVVKPLGKAFEHIKFIYGASILGNGAIALLLDTEKLINN